MRKMLMFLVSLLLATTVVASDEMKKVDFLIGEWQGEATIQMGPGKPQRVFQTETVQAKLGGKILLIEGLGRQKNDDGTSGEVVHQALAVVSWDEAKKTYRFSGYTAQYPAMETTLDVTDGPVAVWAMDVPNGKTRYTITLTEKGEWHEVGEFSRDGSKWMKFFEMTLTKKK
jgi:hypothetical protein